MKSLYKIILVSLSLLFSINNSFSQATVTATINPLNLPCGGGSVNLTALGDATIPVFGDNFDTNGGGLAPGWTTNVNASFNNPCGNSIDGSTYLWMGSSAQAPRALTTPSVDVSCGGEICFDYMNAIQSQASPCEGMDAYNEGVGIQYSTDGGATWITFGYIAPNGDVLATVPTTTAPSTFGTTSLTSWGNHCFTIPAAAYGATTIFRIRQFNSSSAIYDHWGIDNFYITAIPCAPYIYDWEQIPGSPDPQNTSANVTATTTFTVHYTNGVDDAITTVTVTVANITLDNVNITPEACLGDNDASVTTVATTTGGTAPFNYALTGPVTSNNTSGNFAGLSPGLYTVTLTDAAGCSDTYDFTIVPGPACCTVTASGIDPDCNGGNDGTATAAPANGVAPYTYLWNDGAAQTTQTASGLTAGTYSVTITDANGCTSTSNTILGEPTALNSSTTPTDVLCFGGNNGQIVVTLPTGGAAPYTYSINGGTYQASNTFGTLTAANYTLSVQDNNGCLFPLTETIGQPLLLTLIETANTDAICGQPNGSTTVLAADGTGPYSYQLGATTNATGIFPGLSAGNYTVTVTDGNLCTETLNITIGNSAGPIPSLDAFSNVACAGGLNGSATIATAGGTGPYQYSLDGINFQASNTFVLAAGNYTVTVQDANMCTGDVTFDIVEPAPLTFTATPTDALCFGDCNGIIDITINTPLAQQSPPYTYSSDNGLVFQSSNSLTGLCSGNINVVVKDNNGCLANVTTPIGEPALLTSAFTFVEPSCFGLCDAQINITPTNGGTTPYLYSIDNGTTFNALPNFTNQCAGLYNIIVEDDNGCQLAMNSSIVTSPVQMDFNFLAINPSNCGSPDGSFEIEAFNGTPNYNYSIDAGTTTQASGVFTNLFSGNYTLVVTDANGCTESTFSSLSDLQMTSILNGTQDVTCYNGDDGIAQVSVTAGGVAPITFVLSTLANGYVSPPQASGLFLNLEPGLHAITVSDNGSCVNAVQLTILEPDTILFDITATDLSCPTVNGAADGTITFSNPTGGNGVGGGALGAPYEYSIDGGLTYQVLPTFNNLISGPYTVYVKDGNGCEGQSTITLNEPDAFDVVINPTNLTCNGNNTGFIHVVANGATAPYSFDLDGTTNTTGIYPTLAANAGYTVTITDDNGCLYDTIQEITEPDLLTATYITTDANCNTVCDGEVDVTVNGGVPNYLYSADNGITYQSSTVLTGLCAGNHQIRVKDDNDCIVDAVQIIGEPTLITFSMISTPATCGNNNASVTITVDAGTGTAPYQYSASSDNGLTFSPLQTAITIVGLSASTYIIKVTDDNGCEVTESINLSADALPIIDLVETTDPLCFGDNNGIIEITVSNGVGPYQYSVQIGTNITLVPSNQFNSLTDGIYNIIVEDANGCQTTATSALTEPSTLTIASTVTDLLCFENFTGAIDLVAGGGTSPYQYSIDNGTTNQGSGTFSFIASGNYNALITDYNNCTITDIPFVDQPNQLTWNTIPLVITDPLCFNDCNGSIATDVIGGTTLTGDYNYQWSSAVGTVNESTATGVCSGTYSVIITDDNNCLLDSLNFVLNNPLPVQISAIGVTDALCYGDCNGEIIITVPVQIPAINEFSIDNGITYSTSNTFNTASGDNICAGDYDIMAKNTNGCTTTFITTVAEPDELIGGVPPSSEVCYEEDVLVLPLIPMGGTAAYTYDWTDSDGGTYNTETINQIITTMMTFTLMVTDINNCVAGPYSYTVSPTPQLTALASADVSICPGDSTVLFLDYVSGGQTIDFGNVIDYAYSWSPGTTLDTLTTYEVSPIVETTYILTVSDACNDSITDEVIVSVYTDPTPNIMGGGLGCVPYEAELSNPNPIVANGGTSIWNLGDGTTISNQDALTHIYENTGVYDISLSVETAEGCTGSITYTELINVNPNPIAEFYFTPATPTTADQNVEFINISEDAETYQWTFGDYGTSFEENPFFHFNIDVQTTVEICLTATSDMGCIDETCHDLTIYEELLFYVPNVFTPDGDDYNEAFKPIFTSGFDPYDYHLIIFNRWGEVMFESRNANYGWSGIYTDGLVADGVYIWQIEFGSLINDKREKHRGHVTLLK
jgi:gliding motility-associated-like protein